jgi:hypothetical protein
MSRDLEQYHFDPHDAISDIEHLHCMRIHLREEPSANAIQQLLRDLYVQRFIRPEMLFMAPKDLEDLRIRLIEELRAPFVKDEDERYPSLGGRPLKKIFGVSTYPMECLEHRFVIVGFMPLSMW